LVIFEFTVYLATSVPYILVVNGTFFCWKIDWKRWRSEHSWCYV